MNQKKFLTAASLAACAATAALVVPGALAASTSPPVTVRVEGLKHTLLAPKAVKVPSSGWITKGGTPTGQCSAHSAAGALDAATRHRWNGTFTPSFGLEVITILGESHPFTSKYYWGIWVNHRYAQAGVCGLTLHQGDELLFGALADSAKPRTLGLTTPRRVTAGRRFTVKVVWFNPRGKSRPLAGARVDGHTTNTRGIATLTAPTGKLLVLQATKKGYIRSAPARVSLA